MPSDFVDLRKNGTVGLPFPDRTIVLRRPNLGEFRTLREGFDDLADAGTDAILEVRDLSDRLDEEVEEDKKKETPEDQRTSFADKRQQIRQLRRKLTANLEQQRTAWLVNAVQMLGDGPYPADEVNTPSWVLDPNLAAELVQHWQRHPTPPSGGPS